MDEEFNWGELENEINLAAGFAAIAQMYRGFRSHGLTMEEAVYLTMELIKRKDL